MGGEQAVHVARRGRGASDEPRRRRARANDVGRRRRRREPGRRGRRARPEGRGRRRAPFRVSRLGGARSVCVRISPGFLVIANFLRDGPRPVGAPRLARWPTYSPIGFFRFVRNEAARARSRLRRATGDMRIDLKGPVARTWSETPAFVSSFVRPKTSRGLDSDLRFSLLQASYGRPKRGCDTRRRIGLRETRFMPKTTRDARALASLNNLHPVARSNRIASNCNRCSAATRNAIAALWQQ